MSGWTADSGVIEGSGGPTFWTADGSIAGYVSSASAAPGSCRKIIAALPPVLTTQLLNATTAQITWLAIFNAASYILYRNGVAIFAGTALTYTDSGLAPDTTFNYTITSVSNLAGESRPSAPSSLTTPLVVNNSTRVWAPGHYLDTGSGTIRAGAMKPGLAAVVVRKPWNSLEITDHVYSLGSIGTLLNSCAGYGVYLMLMIEGKSFNQTQYAPPRLVPYTTHFISVPDPTKGGYVIWRHHPTVVAAFQPLVQAIGAYVAAHPNKAWFAGIATQETSGQFAPGDPGGDPNYHAADFIDALCLESDYITAACVTGRGMHYVNQIPGNGTGSLLPKYYNRIRANGGMYGFPDATMGNSGLHSNVFPWVLNAHNLGGVTFGSVQNAEYQPKAPADARTMLALYQYLTAQIPDDFGDRQQHADVIVWTDHQTGARNYDSEAVTVIQNHPPPFGTVTPVP